MTKYILHGGETKIDNKNNEAFYQEWIKDFKSDFVPTILLVYFACKKEEWEGLEKQDRERFAKYTDNRSANFIIASSDLNIFREQTKKSDVVYVRGGSSEMLMNTLLPIKDQLLEIFKDKVYAGSSAGVMILADYARSINTDWKKGFELLPINTFVHFTEKAREELELFKNNHPESKNEYLLIPETEFIIKNY
jgi:peptidase E